MNFKQLVNELAREGGVGGGGAIQSVDSPSGETARIVSWIRRADLDIQGLYFDWKFLWKSHTLTTSDGTSDYTGPSDVHFWDSDKVAIGDNRAIAVIEYELWDGYDDGAKGQPWQIIVMPDNSLKLYPTPDDAYTVSLPYYRTPRELDGNSDEPLIPSPFHDVIWMRALLKYGFYEAASDVIQRVRTEYPERLRALESHQLPNRYRYQLSQDPDPVVVIPE